MAYVESVINELIEHIEDALSTDSDYVNGVRTDLLQTTVGLLRKQTVRTIQRIAKSEDNGTYFTMIWYECEECGHKINGDDTYCGGCGKEIVRDKQIKPESI